MMKKFNLRQILFIQLILQLSFSQEEICKTNQNSLLVPETGCTLAYSEQISVKEIILNGELRINRRSHLKYESISVKSEKAGIQIISNYERIIIEDISQGQCDFQVLKNSQDKINLGFAASSKNELFDIEYVDKNTYRVVNRLPYLLYRGANVIIFNEFEKKQTKVIDISGEKVTLQDELNQKQSSLYKRKENKVSKIHHQLLLFDDNRIIFKNNCLNFYLNQKLFASSHGAIFLNSRGLKLETVLDTNVLNLYDIIVFDSIEANEIQSNMEIKANTKDIIFMSSGKSVEFFTKMKMEKLLIIHQQIFKFRVISEYFAGFILVDAKLYGSNGQLSFSTITENIQTQNIVIANCKLDLEVNNEYDSSSISFDQGLLSKSQIQHLITITKLLEFKNFVINSELNMLQDIGCILSLQNSIFDGTGLDGAIKLNRAEFKKIQIFKVQFANFEKGKYPLIYSLKKQDEQPFGLLEFADLNVEVIQSTFAFDTTNKQLINLEYARFHTDYFVGIPLQVYIFNSNLFSSKNNLRFKNPFFSDKQLSLIDNNYLFSFVSFNMSNGSEAYEIEVEVQNGKIPVKFDEYFPIIGEFEYNIYFRIKKGYENVKQIFMGKETILLISPYMYNKSRNFQNVRIFFDSRQPLQNVTLNGTNVYLNQLDSSLQYLFYLEEQPRQSQRMKVVHGVYLVFCDQGEVIQNQKCAKSCTDPTINPNLGVCFDKTKPHPRYYKTLDNNNKITLKPCSWYCTDCKDAFTCDKCIKNSEINNCRDPNQGEFASPNQKIEQCHDASCKNCSSKESCSTCNQNMGIDNNVCKPLKNNQYMKYQNIYQCPDYCNKCYSDTYCAQCKDGYEQILGTCVKQCEVGYFYNGLQCEKCSSNEKKCDDERNKRCEKGYVFNKDTQICEKSKVPEPRICDEFSCYPCYLQTDNSCSSPYPFICEKGYYYSYLKQTCLQCNKNCSECQNDANQCTSCAKDFVFIDGVCSRTSPIICEKGQYYSNQEQICMKCNKICSECENDANQCTSCASDNFLINGVCSQCPEKYIRVNNSCQKSCNQGQYFENGQCKDCSENCKECKDFSTCLSCISEDYYIEKGTCIPVIESDSSLSQGVVIGIVLGSILGLLFIILIIIIIIKNSKRSNKCHAENSVKNGHLKAKNDQWQTNVQLPTQTNIDYNIQSLQNVETQNICLNTEQGNKILQTITSI